MIINKSNRHIRIKRITIMFLHIYIFTLPGEHSLHGHIKYILFKQRQINALVFNFDMYRCTYRNTVSRYNILEHRETQTCRSVVTRRKKPIDGLTVDI
jgi:hypothetical protein